MSFCEVRCWHEHPPLYSIIHHVCARNLRHLCRKFASFSRVLLSTRGENYVREASFLYYFSLGRCIVSGIKLISTKEREREQRNLWRRDQLSGSIMHQPQRTKRIQQAPRRDARERKKGKRSPKMRDLSYNIKNNNIKERLVVQPSQSFTQLKQK